MHNIFARTEMLIGQEAIEKLKNKKVMIFGIGGVGSFAIEALARVGIGSFVLVDHDTIDLTNINRQLLALHSTIGKAKVELMKERIKDINPEAEVICLKKFYSPETSESFFSYNSDYIVDAIDTVTSKVDLITKAIDKNIPIISSMGMGNRLDPQRLKIGDISKTTVCPFARVIRKELRKRGIKSGLDVVFSDESPIIPKEDILKEHGRHIPGSISFVPPVSGFLLASKVVKNLLKESV